MRRMLAICGVTIFGAALALAETYTGQLLDASCYAQSKSAKSCQANTGTSSFLLEASGKVYALDQTGNTKATEAIKARADRASDPNHAAAGPINAKVTGTMEGDTLKVESVEVQ